MPLEAYTRYPSLTTASPQLTQDHYRWYDNADALQPTTELADEDTTLTDVADTDVLRMRLSLAGAAYTTFAGAAFKLQYSTSTGGPWTDVGGVGSGETWRGFDNASVSDGAALPATLLSTATTVQTYEEANNTTSTPNVIAVGDSAEWDWVVEANGVDASTTYYFRMVFADGTPVDTYSQHPTVSTASGGEVLAQLEYRWYENADAISPGSSLAAEDTAAANLVEGTPYHLRVNIENTGTNLGTGLVFKLQFGNATSGPWTDVGGLGSGEVWRGFDNSLPDDGAALPEGGTLLSSSTNARRQTYEEANSTAATPATILKNKRSEWAWVLQPNATLANTTYFLRMVRDSGAPLESYTTYPEVTMGNATPNTPASLGPSQLVDNTAGWSTDSTPTLEFSLADPDAEQQLQYRVQIATDSGFTALVVDYTSDLQAQGATTFTVGQTGGTYTVGSQGMVLADAAAGYFWRVKAIDEAGAESGFRNAGITATVDIRVDVTPPTPGTVLDGSGPDIEFNDGSLTTMSANWSGFSDATSGIASYDHSIGTTPGATDLQNWTTTGTSTFVTSTGLVLHTGQTYYFNVRATDAAGNVTVSPPSSNGQAVQTTLSVSVSTTTIQLGNFNPGNSNTRTTTVTIAISTNAFNGYAIKVYALDLFRSLGNPAVIIPDFAAGTYASPAVWSGTGWGFNTDDCDLNGGAFWTGAGCTGSPKYAPITRVSPGNVVAEHTDQVTGATGAVVSEQLVITLRATTSTTQEGTAYSTSLVFVVVGDF